MKICEISSKEGAREYLDYCVDLVKPKTNLELSEILSGQILEWREEFKKDSSSAFLSDKDANHLIGISFLLDVAPIYYFDLLEKSKEKKVS